MQTLFFYIDCADDHAHLFRAIKSGWHVVIRVKRKPCNENTEPTLVLLKRVAVGLNANNRTQCESYSDCLACHRECRFRRFRKSRRAFVSAGGNVHNTDGGMFCRIAFLS